MSTTGSASDDETSESDIEECSAEVLSVLQGSVRVFCSGKMLITLGSLGFGTSRFFGGT